MKDTLFRGGGFSDSLTGPCWPCWPIGGGVYSSGFSIMHIVGLHSIAVGWIQSECLLAKQTFHGYCMVMLAVLCTNLRHPETIDVPFHHPWISMVSWPGPWESLRIHEIRRFRIFLGSSFLMSQIKANAHIHPYGHVGLFDNRGTDLNPMVSHHYPIKICQIILRGPFSDTAMLTPLPACDRKTQPLKRKAQNTRSLGRSILLQCQLTSVDPLRDGFGT